MLKKAFGDMKIIFNKKFRNSENRNGQKQAEAKQKLIDARQNERIRQNHT